jgi:hypothetical protein
MKTIKDLTTKENQVIAHLYHTVFSILKDSRDIECPEQKEVLVAIAGTIQKETEELAKLRGAA